MNKQYLGDGVYVKGDGFGLMLTTEDGISATNSIYLEPEVYNSLEAYVKANAAKHQSEPPYQGEPGLEANKEVL